MSRAIPHVQPRTDFDREELVHLALLPESGFGSKGWVCSWSIGAKAVIGEAISMFCEANDCDAWVHCPEWSNGHHFYVRHGELICAVPSDWPGRTIQSTVIAWLNRIHAAQLDNGEAVPS